MAEFQRLAGLTPSWDWAKSAVIAREWSTLEPVRAYCELNGIPVQMADEHAPQFWRLRETQALLDWLHKRPTSVLDPAALRDWVARQPATTWCDMLREAVEEYALEANEAELPAAHFREWLAEWGQEARRRQTALLLTTAHRAKGLEFDHVAVLAGAWAKVGENEDIDAPRRLFYVAMTRAKHTLTLARCDSTHPLIETLRDQPYTLWRERTELPAPSDGLRREYRRLSPKEVDLGYAGRFAGPHRIHRAIARLQVGDAVSPKLEKDRWVLQNEQGQNVGRLSQAFKPPENARFVSGKVAAVLVRTKADSDPEYAPSIQCDRWEVVLPELVFSPTP
jgi:ATP-dependent DNA helicase RecQ